MFESWVVTKIKQEKFLINLYQLLIWILIQTTSCNIQLQTNVETNFISLKQTDGTQIKQFPWQAHTIFNIYLIPDSVKTSNLCWVGVRFQWSVWENSLFCLKLHSIWSHPHFNPLSKLTLLEDELTQGFSCAEIFSSCISSNHNNEADNEGQ